MHVVLPWPGSVDPLPGLQAQGEGPGESTTPKRFSPGLGSIVRGWWEQPARVLAKRPLEAAGEVFQRERAGCAQRPHRPGAGPSRAPAPGQPCPDLPGLRGYCPSKGQAAGTGSRHARAPPQAHPRWCLSPGPRPRLRPPWRGGCWQGLSPHCKVLELRGPRQREETSMGLDAQDLFGPAASGQQGEQEAQCAPRSALPLPTQAASPAAA